MKEKEGETEAKEGVESAAAEAICNGVDGHENGVEDHVNNMDEGAQAFNAESGTSVKNEDSDDDLANVSVPQLIDKFENLDQGDSEEERSGEYNLKADESQEIPFTVDTAEESQHEVKDNEIAEKANTEIVKSEETLPVEDEETVEANVTKTFDQALEIAEETVPKEDKVTEAETVSEVEKEEEGTVSEEGKEEEAVSEVEKEETVSEVEKDDEETVSEVEKEEEGTLKTEEDTEEEAVEAAVEEAVAKEDGETVEAVSNEEEETVEEAALKEEMETDDEANGSTADSPLAGTVEDAVSEVTESQVETTINDREGQSEQDAEVSSGSDLVTKEEIVTAEDKETITVESENSQETALHVAQDATSEAVEEPNEESESVQDVSAHVDVSNGESNNQKETVIDNPGEDELEEVEEVAADLGDTGNSPKETFLRQDTYTVSSSSVVTSQTSSSLLRQDTYVVEQDEEDLEEKAEKEIPPPENVLQATSEHIAEYSDEPIYKEADGEDEDEEEEEVKVAKTEDRYVTAEEVRIQKHSLEKRMSSSSSTKTSTTITSGEMTEQLLTKNIEELTGEKTVEALPENTLPLASLVIAGNLGHRENEEKVKVEDIQTKDAVLEEKEEVEGLEEALLTGGTVTLEEMRRRSDVDQLVQDIRDPGLDSSLESIAAMVEVILAFSVSNNQRILVAHCVVRFGQSRLHSDFTSPVVAYLSLFCQQR